MLLKNIFSWVVGIVASVVVIVAIVMGSSFVNFLTFKVLPQSTENIIYFMGYGGNSGLVIGNEAALLIDTKLGKGAKKLQKYTKEIIGDKKLYVVNTHFHADHISGNALYKGSEIIAGNYGKPYWTSLNKEETLPTKWIDSAIDIDLGGKLVQIIPIGQNHTTNDLFIYIPDEKVLFTGDVYTHESHPVMKEDSKPNITIWEETLRSYYSNNLEIKLVIPGHGNIAGKQDLLSIAEYFVDFKTKPKHELRKKYRKWEKLPFLATTNQSWDFIRSAKSKS
jgi:glyoxylase-like metal-dependent hydrolase (beta-lactamase superfamily II)